MRLDESSLETTRRRRGQDFAEYGIALAIIALGAAAVAAVVAGDVSAIWQAAQDVIEDALP